MKNRQFLELAQDEIEAQIRQMPETYTSRDFYKGFEANYPQLYEDFIHIYMDRNGTLDRPHAVQIVHTQLMHTVNDRFHHLTRKARTIRNPKGGKMSEWARV
jgi:hypothetical protein